MGQHYSQPRPGTKLQVIGAGLPRTGTASISSALEILLDGPVYHGATQVLLGPEKEIKTWIQVLMQWHPQENSTRRSNLDLIKERIDGFVAITDSPGSTLVPELMTLYPDAIVICTVRDVEAWERSMATVSSKSTQWFLRFVLFPVPSLRYFVDYIDALRQQWFLKYGETEPVTSSSYDQHITWLKEKVPENRLVFLQVHDGWEPLCKALDLPVPKDVPFPRINDSQAIDNFAKRHVTRGLVRWGVILLVVGVSAWTFLW
ncbi:Ff.00g133790.m01.CDS01 [Fusarium sp. VM40]|nr:Ff.00g133790.m01.CDS01 [Fusarium sp. VM40]